MSTYISPRYKYLVTYFVEYFNVSRSKRVASSEKVALASGISRGNGVCLTACAIRILVVQSVVHYADIMISTTSAKSGSVRATAVHCKMLISILSQFNRIISFGVVKREEVSFTG